MSRLRVLNTRGSDSVAQGNSFVYLPKELVEVHAVDLGAVGDIVILGPRATQTAYGVATEDLDGLRILSHHIIDLHLRGDPHCPASIQRNHRFGLAPDTHNTMAAANNRRS